ncbi:MAG: DUF4062 domain-containing protein [Oscillospiraceae bacterium]|jgi:hypothetical protein|nr:DUF4062 domain-containing protein [Oscillospiraceae bacterium]
MSLGRKPTVFISSTCYDLKQIRADIKIFFDEQLGYDVLLSEYDSFPLDPNAGTVDNCLRAVDERADIFVLIVGCRYGSVTETGRSVTNLEYLKAKAKGIPIYAFVDTFRSGDSIWSFGFESAQDIMNTLKLQLSYLFSDCLSLHKKATQKRLSKKVMNLDADAFKTAILCPTAWEYKLFGQVLTAGLDELVGRRRDFNFGITLAPIREILAFDELTNYISLKTEQLIKASNTLSTLIYKTLPEAFGEPGVEGDADYIVYAANRLLEVYSSIIDWSLEFNAISTNEDYCGIVNSFSKMCEATLCDIERFAKEYCEMIASIPDNISDNSDFIPLSITLELSPPDTVEFNYQVDKLRKKHGLIV